MLRQIDRKNVDDLGRGCRSGRVWRRYIRSDDLGLTHLKPQKTKIRLIVLLQCEAGQHSQWSFGRRSSDLLERAQLGIPSRASDHAGQRDLAFGSTQCIGEALVVVDMS